MQDTSLPPSDFLRAIVEERIVCGPDGDDEANLIRLMALTRDADTANRDWATCLLSDLAIDRADVRETLLAAAWDEDAIVRAEAILGLAQLDTGVALPLLRNALAAQEASLSLFEAARIVADPALLDDVMAFAAPSDDPLFDQAVRDAIKACSPRG